MIDPLLIQARPYKAMDTNINIHISNHGLYNHQIHVEELFPIIKTVPYYCHVIIMKTYKVTKVSHRLKCTCGYIISV